MNFHQKVIYQIYPKSFYDSNGDGIGDLPGIIAKLDYLKKLSIDMIWLNPFFVSPQDDNGYDVANYEQIDPRFGTMADFDTLIAKLKAAGIEVMLDMVLNHTSTQHEWFQRALAGDPKYQAYYYLRKAKPNGSLPTNWSSKFGGPAWAKFGDTDQYYLHLYGPTQADLDWHNPEVRQQAAHIINFWRRKGVRGFRFDVLNVIGKSEKLVDAPPNLESKTLYTDTPVVNDYIKELAANSFGQSQEVITVGEMSSTTIEKASDYTAPQHNELSMVFQFHHLKTDYDHGQKWTKKPYDFNLLRDLLHQWGVGMAQNHGWMALFWNNHDQPRALNRFGDTHRYRVKSAQMLAASIHLNRGTPYIYQGEEIGMSDPDYTSMSDYVDLEAHNAYRALRESGHSEREAFEIVHLKARDNSRTPMQWDNRPNAGFTTGIPWLRPTNQKQVNVKQALADGRIFTFYQHLIQLRKKYSVISDGDYRPFGTDIAWLYAYERHLDGQALLVLNNFAKQAIKVRLPVPWQTGRVLLTNQPNLELGEWLKLEPFTTLAIFIQKEETK